MCYRCSLCLAVVPPKVPRLLFTTYRAVPNPGNVVVPDPNHGRRTVRYEWLADRTRKEVARELPVCRDCHGFLESGVSVPDLIRMNADYRARADVIRSVLSKPPTVPNSPVPQGGRRSANRPV